MANTIRIKRRASGSTGAPGSLENAELAYNEVDDTLYYGKGTGGAGGTATTVEAIGGSGAFVGLAGTQTITGNKTFSGTVALGASASATTQTSGDNTTKVATTAYVKTAIDNVSIATSSVNGLASFDITDFTVTSGLVTLKAERIEDIVGAMVSSNTESGISVSYDDANGKIDFNVSDPTITIAGDVDGYATMTNLGDTTINVTLDTVNSNTGSFGSSTAIPIIAVNGKGLITSVSTASISTSLTVTADTGTADSVALGTDTLTFAGGEGIDTAVTNNTITISGEDATSSNKGIASFSSDSFSVSSGAVTIKSGGVSNTQLANSSITIGTTTTSLGSTSGALAGLDQIDVDNIRINGNEISSTDTNGNISLNPNGTGNVDVNNAKITGLAEPSASSDAATKGYVDNKLSGLTWKESVNVLATTNVPLTGSTPLTVDSHALSDGYRLLLKGQTTGSQNGIYDLAIADGEYTLTRASDADVYSELVGASVFVEEGTSYAKTGWVQSNHYLTDFSGQVWNQFSGAGTYSAGSGLVLTDGTVFDINLATNSGLKITADELQVDHSIAGNGLTFSAGVLTVGGTTDRISVTSDNVDIASTYAGQSSIVTLGTITSGTWTGTTIAIANGGTGSTNASDARTALGLAIGTNVQAYDAELAAIAGLTSASDKLPYFTGSGTAALASFTSFGRSLVDDTDASSARTTLGLGTIATQDSNNVTITGGSINGISIDGGSF